MLMTDSVMMAVRTHCIASVTVGRTVLIAVNARKVQDLPPHASEAIAIQAFTVTVLLKQLRHRGS